jgi:glycosyltransferase
LVPDGIVGFAAIYRKRRAKNKQMRISVITVSYNSAATIVDTVESVLGQTGVNLEYIVMDGGSTDATMEKLGPYRNRIAQLVSEPDGGMYDAMNKGIARATGEVVAILNSDDVYADSGVLARVAAAFGRVMCESESEGEAGARTLLSAESGGGPDVVYGDLHYVSPDLKREVRDWRSGAVPAEGFRRGWHPPHPAFFVKRAVYAELGGFRMNLRIAADYEYMLRVLEKSVRPVVYLPEVMVKMRTGGASNRSLLNVLKANWECYQAWRMNGYGVWTGGAAVVRKPFTKLKQLRC